MKAALIARYGSNDLVKVADTAVPVIGSMDLLVQVHAASVNPVDVKADPVGFEKLRRRGLINAKRRNSLMGRSNSTIRSS